MLHSTENLVDKSSSEPLVLIKTDSPYFTIIDHNQAFADISRTNGVDILGKSIVELHKWDSSNEESTLLIYDSLHKVIAEKQTVKLPAIRFDMFTDDLQELQTNWWQTEYQPVLAADGNVEYILCAIKNITQQMQEASE
ncbi:MAG: hypothetical protein EOP42_04285 [Sphingobacteriaceae bacterium]|nr:MAG: hypothetical protein EOP42_04285 [Sphingobacteriaceae bacterium]